MRQVTVDARDKNNRVTQFEVVTTILDVSIDGQQIGDLFERRWEGEVDIRSIKSTMQMDILRCKTPTWCTKRFGLTCWRTTYFAPSWLWLPRRMTPSLAK